MNHITRIVLILAALSLACDGLKQNSEDCDSNDECLSECCYPSTTRQPWCSAGTVCMKAGGTGGGGGRVDGGTGGGGGRVDGGTGGGAGGGGGGTTMGNGACAYYHASLNRILCDPNATSAASCNGKYAAGASCSTLSCPQGTTNPQNCSF